MNCFPSKDGTLAPLGSPLLWKPGDEKRFCAPLNAGVSTAKCVWGVRVFDTDAYVGF